MNKKIILAAVAAAMTVSACSCGAKVSYDFDLSEYVTVAEYKGIEIADADIQEAYNETIDTLKEQYTTTQAVEDRAIQKGDTVSVDYTLTSGETELDKQTSYSVTVGAGVVEFEEVLIGQNKGDALTYDVTLPEDYSNADYAGAAATYSITVGNISIKDVPEIDDAFVSENYGDTYESAEDFLAQTLETTKKTLLWEQIIAESKVIKYPEENIRAYYDQYVEYNINMYQSYANATGQTIQQIYQMLGTSSEAIYEQAASAARSDVKNDLVVLSIAEKEGITLDDATYTAELEAVYADYGYESAKQMEKQLGRDAVERMFISDLVVEMIAENAIVK